MDDWLDEMFLVMKEEPEVAHGSNFTLALGYTDGSMEEESKICNTTRSDGVMCRVWNGHPGPHIPFAVEIVVQQRVHVTGIEEL